MKVFCPLEASRRVLLSILDDSQTTCLGPGCYFCIVSKGFSSTREGLLDGSSLWNYQHKLPFLVSALSAQTFPDKRKFTSFDKPVLTPLKIFERYGVNSFLDALNWKAIFRISGSIITFGYKIGWFEIVVTEGLEISKII
jgi:hypothetical protein